jgi:glycosyltransferase involved in cell wall biosynthesis
VIDVRASLRAPVAADAPRLSSPPKLSVIVPAFNAQETIADAIDSVLEQTVPVHEIIVSDDGSTDDTASIIKEYGDAVVVLRAENAGLATARNRAAAIATGTHLALLDADDVWMPERAYALARGLELRPDLSVLTTDSYIVRDGQRAADTYYALRDFPVTDQFDAILRSSFVFGAAAIRRSSFEAVGGYDPRSRFAEDWDLWIRLLLRGGWVGLVDVPLYEYRRREGSLTSRRLEGAMGVIGMLTRASSLPMSEESRDALLTTRAAWRARAVREAAAEPLALRLRLAGSALSDRRLPLSESARIAALLTRSTMAR